MLGSLERGVQHWKALVYLKLVLEIEKKNDYIFLNIILQTLMIFENREVGVTVGGVQYQQPW